MMKECIAEELEIIDEPISFEELVKKIEVLLEEPVLKWKNNDRLIKKIGVVTGAGFSAN